MAHFSAAFIILLLLFSKALGQPAAFSEMTEERRLMVQNMESEYGFKKGVKESRVLDALRKVPRHAFVPPSLRSLAYKDTPIPIGHGQTISQPYIVGLMTDLLELSPESKVLEIGTGSGYQAAVLAELTPNVFSIEVLKPLSQSANQILQDLGYKTVQVREGDGYYGWPEAAPFDAIIVTCAAGHLPPPLWDQLKPGGRIVVPIGGAYEVQRLVVLTKTPEGNRTSRSVLDVRFVPMIHEGEP